MNNIQAKNIRILHLRSSGGLYGAEMVILNAGHELNGMRCHNHVCCINNLKNPHSELVDEAAHYGIEASSVDAMSMLDWETVKDIRRKLKDGGFDVLHCHDYKASVYGALASFGLKIRRVVTNHLWDKIDLKLWLYQRIEGMLYNYFDAIVAVSEEVKRDIRPLIVHKSKIEVIENGIDVSAFGGQRTENGGQITDDGKGGIRSRFGLKEVDIVIGIVGRLVRQKGHCYLLKAFKKLLANGEQITDNGNLKLLIVGDGPLDDQLRALCSELGLSFRDLLSLSDDSSSVLHSSFSVIFTGVQTDMPAVYQAIDILAMPSLEEGLPMVLLEAMASGVPVVAAPVGQIPKIIKDGETGFLVPSGDVDALREVLAALIDRCRVRPPGEPLNSGAPRGRALQDIITNAKELVETKYSANAMAKKYLEIYEWLVE